MEVAQRDFWWGFEDKRGTYVTSWKNLRVYKDCGGQGFKDLKILNKALLVRAAWRICTNTDTHWGKAIQAKYFSCTSLLHAIVRTNFSWAWNGIQKQIEFIKQNSHWRLGKGDKIKVWLDVCVLGLDNPPVPREDITDRESYIRVQDLMLQDRQNWNSDLI
ncbi:uncharacterized protein LOC113359151 [Papaver somniferum]|uniref:uncharacterized protein LOC113359151 n=1 Tax=Papaver somniferum TaxID=3469 RepID=UPI000E7000D5|nr:uncharacterized protein LOC113359151 [Papaver somniferum]